MAIPLAITARMASFKSANEIRIAEKKRFDETYNLLISCVQRAIDGATHQGKFKTSVAFGTESRDGFETDLVECNVFHRVQQELQNRGYEVSTLERGSFKILWE